MIEELKEALAADPENPYLQGHVEALEAADRKCRDASTNCYAVVACRWGWINNGFALLRVTSDLPEAIAAAEIYANYRGGKYGVGVFNTNGQQVHHAASCYGEKKLHHNWRIDTFERVGGLVSCAFEAAEEPDMERVKRQWEDSVRMEGMLNSHSVTEHQPAPTSTECDNCGSEIPVLETHGCDCGATLCPECICENCDG